MPARNLKTMTVDALRALRQQVDTQLAKRRAELEGQLERIGGAGGVRKRGRPTGRRGSMLRGRKVPPKYRGPQGETWAGRGARPRWLVALLRQGHKVEEFAIDKGVGKKRSSKKRRVRGLAERAERSDCEPDCASGRAHRQLHTLPGL